MAKRTIRSGVNNHPEVTVLQLLTDLVRKGGLVSLENDFVVTEKPGTPDMSVTIGIGNAYVEKDGNCYPINSDTTENIAVSASNPTNPRKDALILYVDTVATPGASNAGEDIVHFKVVAGTAAASPVAPDDSTIQGSIGASDPWIRLRTINVPAAVTAILDSHIDDSVAKRVYMRSTAPLLAESPGATYAHDFSETTQVEITLTANLTFNEPTNMERGDWLVATFIQDGTGGRTVSGTFWNAIKWPSGVSPIVTATANKRSTVAIRKINDTDYEGWIMGLDQ